MGLTARSPRRPASAILLIAILAGAAGCSGGEAPAPEVGQGVAESFLGDIRAGKVDEAWRATSAEFKSMLGQEGLRRFVKKNPATREPAEFLAIEPVDRNGIPMAECSFRATKRPATLRVLLAREGEGWKVERLVVE